jgi:hypothetical protein
MGEQIGLWWYYREDAMLVGREREARDYDERGVETRPEYGNTKLLRGAAAAATTIIPSNIPG